MNKVVESRPGRKPANGIPVVSLNTRPGCLRLSHFFFFFFESVSFFRGGVSTVAGDERQPVLPAR
jgi:hypothetical protein